jgi:hypothetical protein
MASVHRKPWQAATGWTVTAAAGVGYLLCTAAPAAAQPISVPGMGMVEVPNDLPIPAGLAGIELPTPAGVSAAVRPIPARLTDFESPTSTDAPEAVRPIPAGPLRFEFAPPTGVPGIGLPSLATLLGFEFPSPPGIPGVDRPLRDALDNTSTTGTSRGAEDHR